MIKLEKLEKGEFFEDAFLVSYRYNKDYLNKMRSLKYKRYVPDKKAWEIPSSELKHLVDLFGVDDINVNAKYLEGLVEKEESKAEEAPEDIKERLKDIKPIVDYPFKTKPLPCLTGRLRSREKRSVRLPLPDMSIWIRSNLSN